MIAATQARTYTADESAALLAALLLSREAVLFTKYGDAEIRWSLQFGDQQAEGECGTPKLGAALLDAWRVFGKHPHTFMGDWQTASFGVGDETQYPEQWGRMLCALEREPVWMHYESLLLMRLTPELRDFYRVIATASRNKILIAPKRLAGAANLLRAEHHQIPLQGACSIYEDVVASLRRADWDVLLFCAGRAAKLIMADLCQEFPERTYIDLGSALDPLFGFQTRSGQVSTGEAWQYFAELW